MLYALDIFGTFVFAISGAFRAVKHRLDVLGVLVLAVVTGVGGGILRDLLLGRTPPVVFQDERYLATCLLGGLVVFLAPARIASMWDCVMAADAVGLSVFAAIGAAKGADSGMGTIGIIMMAAMTATGGGVLRDVLVMEIPAILRTDFYASAAIVGGVSYTIARAMGLPPNVQLILCIVLTCLSRLLAMRWGTSLPKANGPPLS